MPAFYKIEYLPEGTVEEFAGSRGNYYEFEDGSTIDLQSEPVWCQQCGKVTHGESIEPIEVIEMRIAELMDPDSELYRWTMRTPFEGMKNLERLCPKESRDSFRLELLSNARKRREWREHRQSPPKCIHCGSTNIISFPENDAISGPPGTTIRLRCVGMCSTNFNQWFYTPEGDRIARDTKPTYWHLPGVDDQQWMLKKLLPEMFGSKKGKDIQKD